MATRDAGFTAVLADAIDAVRTRPVVLVFALLGSLFGNVPIVGGFLTSVFNGLATGAAVRGLDVEWAGSRSLSRRILSLLGASLLAGVGIIVGLVLLVIPGIYVLLRTTLVPAETIVGNERAIDAVSASWQRTGGHLTTVLAWHVMVGAATVALVVVLFATVANGEVSAATVQSFEFRLALGVTAAPVGALSAAGIGAMYVRFER